MRLIWYLRRSFKHIQEIDCIKIQTVLDISNSFLKKTVQYVEHFIVMSTELNRKV